MPRYKIKEGHENRVFVDSRRISENTIESDEELNSPYLSPIADDPAPPSAPLSVASAVPQPPIQANPQPADQTQTVNKATGA